jgi:5-methylcytosine-specific restriction endonuclease McrA
MVAADGTATPDQIARLKAGATHCAYCLARLSEKFTDHMIAVALSGPHSLRNIVIVCPTCSGRKADLSYEVWVERLAVEHRMRATTLFAERFGDVRNVA